jgi:hypothetical protein
MYKYNSFMYRILKSSCGVIVSSVEGMDRVLCDSNSSKRCHAVRIFSVFVIVAKYEFNVEFFCRSCSDFAN